MHVFWKIWRALYSCNTHFEILPLPLSPTYYEQKATSLFYWVKQFPDTANRAHTWCRFIPVFWEKVNRFILFSKQMHCKKSTKMRIHLKLREQCLQFPELLFPTMALSVFDNLLTFNVISEFYYLLSFQVICIFDF